MKRPEGLRAFNIIWLGQIGSAVGTRMTAFALGLYVWDKTGKVTDLAILTFCSFAATTVFTPLAGVLVDRWNRRFTIVLSDAASLVLTAGLLVLFATTTVQLWMLYTVATLTGAFLAFQYPVYSATISQMLKTMHFPRANAMMSLVRSLPAVAAPALSALLLTVTNIKVILGIDTASYLLAIGTVFVVTIPRTPMGSKARPASVWHDSMFGFRYIYQRQPLAALLTLSFAITLIAGVTYTVMLPLVLADTGNSSLRGGIVVSVGAAGGVLGGVLVSIMGDRKDKMKYVLGAIIVMGLFGRAMYGIGASMVVWSLSQLFAWGTLPFINGYTQSIWQEKVEREVQGRVFAAQSFMENLSMPVALGLSGVLADRVFGPAMRPHGALAGIFGGLVASKPGAGMAVMCLIGGGLAVVVGVLGFLIPVVRRVDEYVPRPAEVPVEAKVTS